MTTIPTTSELYNSILADLQAQYGSNIPVFGKVMLRAFAISQAGKLKLFYYGLGLLQKNIFIDTADPESSGGTLERFGRIKLGRNPFPAQAGKYQIEITGSVGATVAAQTTFKSNDDSVNPGKLFILDVAYVLVATTDSIVVRALDAGLDSKMSIGEGMTATIPIPLVNKAATVLGETVSPLAAESIEDYRTKGQNSYRTEPQGGAVTDYRLWASDAQGVKQTYPYAKSGAANEINLFIEATEVDSTDGKGTPTPTILSDVEDVVELDPDTTFPIEDRGRRPLGVFDVHYLAITPKDIDIVIDDFVGITAEKQTSIFNALKLALSTVRPFIAGADLLVDKNDILDVNKIISVILSAQPGSIFGSVTMSVDGSPVSTYTFYNGDIPYLDSVTYT
jgi:hypothetical protein